MTVIVQLSATDVPALRHLRWATINRFDIDMASEKAAALALADRIFSEIAEGGWRSNDPPSSGSYLVTFRASTGVRDVMLAYFCGLQWSDFRAGQGAPEVIAWMAIPKPFTESEPLK